MEASAARSSPIERFLGPGREGGALSLLCVRPGYTDAEVIAALNLGLERVNRHPESATPEADEVRLALHAAAALLLNPATRGRVGASGGLDAAAALEHDALLTLAMFGGWNRRAMHRLTLLAHARGLPSTQVHAALSRLMRRPAWAQGQGAARASAAASRPEPKTEPATPDPGARALRRFVTGSVIAAAGLALIGTAATLAVRASKAKVEAEVAASAAEASKEPRQLFEALPRETPRKPASSAAPEAPGSALEDVRACVDGIAVDPAEAVARFDEAVGRLAAEWPSLTPDRRSASHDAVVEFVHRLRGEPELAASAVRSVIARTPRPTGPGESPMVPAAGDVARWAWGVGMVWRLSQERDWPARLVQMLQRSGVEVSDGPGPQGRFERGALFALSRMIPALVPRSPSLDVDAPRVAAWMAWGECVSAASSEAREAERLVLAALDALLLDGPEPHADRTTFEVVTWLAGRVGFGRGEESRAWALRLFDSPAISNGDLFALTRRLSLMPELGSGRDPSLVLATTASARDRAQLRSRYATLWGMAPAASAQRASEAWVKTARRVADLPEPPTEDEAAQLERAVLYSRLSESAWWAWLGHAEASAAALAEAEAVESRSSAGRPAPLPLPDPGGDGGWAERYLAARDAPTTRMQMLNEMSALSGNVGPLQAEVLVQEALRGGPAQVRRLASEIVQRQLRNAAVVNALLEQLPTMPWTAENAALVSRVGFGALPAWDDPARRVVARRLLVERLLELLASEGDAGRIDRGARELAESYMARSGMAPGSASAGGASADPPPAHVTASQARARWRRIAEGLVAVGREPVTLGEIDRRLASRLRLARGPVQTFAAEQLAVCELMALALSAERPESAGRVGEVLRRLAEERRRADHILTQIRVTERAMLDLWMLRLGGAEP